MSKGTGILRSLFVKLGHLKSGIGLQQEEHAGLFLVPLTRVLHKNWFMHCLSYIGSSKDKIPIVSPYFWRPLGFSLFCGCKFLQHPFPLTKINNASNLRITIKYKFIDKINVNSSNIHFGRLVIHLTYLGSIEMIRYISIFYHQIDTVCLNWSRLSLNSISIRIPLTYLGNRS